MASVGRGIRVPSRGGAFPDLATRVLFGQAREEPALLRDLAMELEEMADELLERREARRSEGTVGGFGEPEREFVAMCGESRAVMEAAIALHAAQLLPQPGSRTPGLYSWSLVAGVMRRFEVTDVDPFFAHLVEATSSQAPVPWRALESKLAEVRARMDAAFGWPSSEDAHGLACLFQSVEPAWTRCGSSLPYDGSPRPRGSAERRLLRKAVGACRLARHTFVRLSSPSGWVRLQAEYLLELTEGIARLSGEGRALEEYADVAIHEFCNVASALVGGGGHAAGQALRPYSAHSSGDAAERKRIERGRARCLSRWLVHDPDPCWDEYEVWPALEEIASCLGPSVGDSGE
jgi:hypothetical protein